MTDDGLSEHRLAVLAALHEGDAGLAYRIVLRLLGAGYPFATILEEVVAPIQFESGRRWQAGDYSISEEHVSTAAAEMLLATLAGAFDQPDDAPQVVVCCAVGDLHTMPARMAAALLLAEGYRVTFLGSAVPADDLEAYLAESRPAFVVVACTLATNLFGARDVVAAAHRAGVPVIVGGRAFGSTDARAVAIGADAWAPSLLTLVDLLAAVPSMARPPETRGPEESGALDALRSRAIETLAGALGQGFPERSAVQVAHLDEEAVRLFDTFGVALRLGDAGLLGEHADWLAMYLPTVGIEDMAAPDILRTFARAVGDAGPDAGALIAEAIEGSVIGTAPA